MFRSSGLDIRTFFGKRKSTVPEGKLCSKVLLTKMHDELFYQLDSSMDCGLKGDQSFRALCCAC